MSESELEPSVSARWRAVALMAIVFLGIALVGVVYFAVKKPMSGRVTLVRDGDAAVVNTGAIIDGTDPSIRVTPQVGYRYKVFVEDESDDRSAGVARLGGRTTFIDGARRGQTCIVDVTRVQDRVVNANLVQVVSEISLPPKPPREPYVPTADDPAAFVVEGATLDVIISEASSKNPETEGVAKVEGLVVFVEGATEMGQRVNVRITGRRERMAFAELTGEPAGTEPLPYKEGSVRRGRGAFIPAVGDETAFIVPGAEFDVVITEASSKNPTTEGVARVRGLVIFVDGATTIGERVNVRVTDRRERMAFAELSGKPAGTKPLAAEGGAAPFTSRAAFVPPAGDDTSFVVPGAEFDVIITEASSKNPDTEGVARVRGLVLFVDGATAIGERVNIRVTDRRERMAFAVATGKPVGTGALPYAAPTPRLPRPAYTPPANEDTAFVVPGAEFDVIITETSSKNPTTEGVARVLGLVIFVDGATTIGERVNVRVTDRRERMAFAALTGKPAGTGPLDYATAAPTTERKPAAPAAERKPVAPAAPRKPAAPVAVDSAANVVAGAEMDLIIVEKSKKHPDLEGVAKVGGVVIFVRGATTVGQQVKAHIRERRAGVAFADAIGPATPSAVPEDAASPAPAETVPAVQPAP